MADYVNKGTINTKRERDKDTSNLRDYSKHGRSRIDNDFTSVQRRADSSGKRKGRMETSQIDLISNARHIRPDYGKRAADIK